MKGPWSNCFKFCEDCLYIFVNFETFDSVHSCSQSLLFIPTKVNQSHYRPGQAQRVPGGWGSQISRQSAHEGGKVVSPTHRPPLPPGNIPGTHFCYRLNRPQGHSAAEGLCQWKFPKTPSGIEPATFRLVAQCLNQLRHRIPPSIPTKCT